MYNRHACINAAGRQAFNQSVSVAEAIQISLAAALSFQRRLVLAAAHEAVARTGLSGCGAQLLQRVAALRVGLVRSCLADVQALPDDCRVVRERSGWRRLGVGAGIGVAWRTVPPTTFFLSRTAVSWCISQSTQATQLTQTQLRSQLTFTTSEKGDVSGGGSGGSSG